MKIFNRFLIVWMAAALPVLIQAQKTISEGYIKMEITDADSDDEQVKSMLEMMKGSETEFFFNSEKSLVKANMMGGMFNMTTLLDNNSEDQILLINAMGQKMLVESSKADREKISSEQAEALKQLKVTFDESDQKEILGHLCTKAVISHPDMEAGSLSFVAYVAKGIKANNKLIQGMNYLDLDGFPLEYIMDAGRMKLTFSATKFEDSVDSDVFNLSTGGYKKMTYEEFISTMGQMGGFGF